MMDVQAEYDAIPYVDITIGMGSAEEVEEGTRAVLSAFFPDWNPEYDVKPITDGITNKLFKVKREMNGLRSSTGLLVERCLVRVYGQNTEMFIDREQELKTVIRLSHSGLAMPIYGRFNNGVCYGYLLGKPYSSEEMVDDVKGMLVAKAVAGFHSAMSFSEQEAHPILWATQKRWASFLDEADVDACREHALANGENAGVEISLERVVERVNQLERDIGQSGEYAVAFCHNDLLSGNLLYYSYDGKRGFEEEARIIDYEYSGVNYCAWDIGNHFAEMLGFELDLSLLPPDSYLLKWLQTYLDARRAAYARSSEVPKSPLRRAGDELPDASRFLRHVKMFMNISHLHWGLWSMVQAKYSLNGEFDYQNYAWRKLSYYFTVCP